MSRPLFKVRWRVLRGIIRRDLHAARRNPGVVAPMIILPLVFSIVFPLATFAVSRASEELPLGAFADLLSDTPSTAASSESVRIALALATYVFPTLLIVVPLMVVTVIACDSIAGENERGTLEGLLLTPASDHELYIGKLLGALLPAGVLHFCCSTVYCILINAVFWGDVDGLALPTWSWLAIVWFMGPALVTAALGLTVVISARSKSIASAHQTSAVTALPVLIAVIGQISGVVLLSGGLVLGVGIIIIAAAAAMLSLGSRALNRERLTVRLR